jgi:hypothetical protein
MAFQSLIKPRIVLFGLLLALVLQGLLSIRFKSATWDESRYYGRGVEIFQNNFIDALPESDRFDTRGYYHPPLPHYVSSLPLLLLDVDTRKVSRQGLFLSRSIMLLFPLLLAITLYTWAKKLFGEKGGLFSVLLFCMSPNILAHARLITEDVCGTCFFFLATYQFWKLFRARTRANLVLAGVATGLAFLSKHSNLILIPIFVTLSILGFIQLWLTSRSKGNTPRRPSELRQLRREGMWLVLSLIGIFVISILVVNSAYLFKGTLRGPGLPSLDSGIAPRDLFPEFLVPVLSLLPSPYIKGLLGVKATANFGWTNYLLGEISVTGWWYYFPVVLALKLPLAMLAFIALAIICFPRARAKDWIDESFIVLPPLSFLVYSCFFTNLNIGLRHILLVIPFFHLYVARLVNLRVKRQRVLQVGMALLTLFYVVSSVRAYPHYLSYFNELIGNRINAYKYLADSNLDWGQNNYFLEKFLEENKHLNVSVNPTEPTPGYVIVNASYLVGIFFWTGIDYEWLLKNYEPVDHVAYTWLLFFVPPSHMENFFPVINAGSPHSPRAALLKGLNLYLCDDALKNQTHFLRKVTTFQEESTVPKEKRRCLNWDGFLNAEHSGFYLLTLEAHRRAKLFLNHQLTIDSVRLPHVIPRERTLKRSVLLELKEGFYPLSLYYRHTAAPPSRKPDVTLTFLGRRLSDNQADLCDSFLYCTDVQ